MWMLEPAEYRCKGLVSGGVLPELLISTQLGIGVMVASFPLGLPFWAQVLLLVGTITAVLFICSAEIRYSLEFDGLTRSINPKVLRYKQLKRLTHIDWARIEWYTLDYDRNRSWQAYPYLLIRGKKPYFQWKIAGKTMHDTAFDQFVQSFVQSIPVSGGKQQEKAGEPSFRPAMQQIKPRSGFYRTKVAKFLTLVFVIIDVSIVVGVVTGFLTLSATSMYRLLAVLLPGTFYLLYRTLRS